MNLDRKRRWETPQKFRKMIAAGKTAEAAKYLPEVYKTLDKMKKVGFIKPNKADRLKSRLSKKLPKK